MSAEQALLEVHAWAECWKERMNQGFYGPVTAAEEGNRYGSAVVENGRLYRTVNLVDNYKHN